VLFTVVEVEGGCVVSGERVVDVVGGRVGEPGGFVVVLDDVVGDPGGLVVEVVVLEMVVVVVVGIQFAGPFLLDIHVSLPVQHAFGFPGQAVVFSGFCGQVTSSQYGAPLRTDGVSFSLQQTSTLLPPILNFSPFGNPGGHLSSGVAQIGTLTVTKNFVTVTTSHF